MFEIIILMLICDTNRMQMIYNKGKIILDQNTFYKKIAHIAFLIRAWKYSPSPLVACLLISLCLSRVTNSSIISPSPLINLNKIIHIVICKKSE